MATLEDVVERLDHVSDTLDQVARTQNMMVDLLARQQQQLEVHQQQLEVQQQHLQKLTEEFRLHREDSKEMHRFNQQARRMWILIARNMEWLPEDEDFD